MGTSFACARTNLAMEEREQLKFDPACIVVDPVSAPNNVI
jgi:hypothetical protein